MEDKCLVLEAGGSESHLICVIITPPVFMELPLLIGDFSRKRRGADISTLISGAEV